MAVELASGYVTLTVKYADAMEQIKKQFTATEGVAKTAGGKVGKSFSQGITGQASQVSKGLTAPLKQVTADAAKAGKASGTQFAQGVKSGTANMDLGNAFRGAAPKAKASGTESANMFATAFKATLTAAGIGGVIASVVGGVRSVMTAGLDFERQMNSIQGVTSATTAEMAGMRKVAQDLGADTTLAGTSAADAASAMLELSKGGFTVSDSMKAARATTQLATAAQISAADAATIQVNAINAFKLGVGDAGHIADVFTNAVLGSSMEMPDLQNAMQQVAGVANGMGMTFEDTTATIATFAQMGVKGSDAGTLMKSSLLAWQNATDPQSEALHALNMNLDDGTGKFVGYRNMMEQLSVAANNGTMTQMEFNEAAAQVFGSDAIRAAMFAAKDAGLVWDEQRKGLDKLDSTARNAAAQMQGLPGVVEGIKNAWAGVQLAVFDKIDGPMQDFGNAILALANGQGPQAFKEVIDVFVGGFKNIIDGVKLIKDPVLKIGKALGGMAAGLALGAWSAFGDAVKTAAGFLKPLLELMANNIGVVQTFAVAVGALYLKGKFLNPVLDGFSNGMLKVTGALGGSTRGVGGLADAYGKLNTSVVNVGKQTFTVGQFGTAVGKLGQQYPAINRMQTAFYNSAINAERFGRTRGLVSGAFSGMASAAGGLVSALGGFGGIAFAAIAFGIGQIAANNQKAADAARAHRENLIALRETLDKETGLVTKETQEKIAREFTDKGTDTLAWKLGIDPHQGLLAATGDADAAAAIRTKGTASVTTGIAGGGREASTMVQDLTTMGISAEETTAALLGEGDARDVVNQKIKEWNALQEAGNKDFDPSMRNGIQDLQDVMPEADRQMLDYARQVNQAAKDIGATSDEQERFNDTLNGSWKVTDEGAKRFAALGLSIMDVPDDKTIVTTAITDPAKKTLEDLGYTVERMPNGEVKVTATTEDAMKRIRELIEKVSQNPLVMDVKAGIGQGLGETGDSGMTPGQRQRERQGFAKGSTGVNGPGGIDNVLAWLTRGEGVVTTDGMANGGTAIVGALNSGWSPQGLPGFRGGGQVFKAGQIPWPPGPIGPTGDEEGNIPDPSPGKYPGRIAVPDWSVPGQGWGPPPADWWGRPVNPDDVLFPDAVDPGKRQQQKDLWERLHPRIKLLGLRGMLPGFKSGSTGVGNDSTKEDLASAIIGEAISRGYTESDARAILATAIGESGLSPTASNGDHIGLFQQDAGYPGRNAAASQITGFFDRLDKTTGDIYDRITRTPAQGGVQGGGYGEDWVKQYEAQAEELASASGGLSGATSSTGGTAAQQRAIREKNDRITDLQNQLDSQTEELSVQEANPKTKPTTLERKRDQVAKTTRDLQQAKDDLAELVAKADASGATGSDADSPESILAKNPYRMIAEALAEIYGGPAVPLPAIFGAIPGFRKGSSTVRGPGGTDNVLAMLTRGEGVVTTTGMANGGNGIVAALNAGWVPPVDYLKSMLPGYAQGLNPGANMLRSEVMRRFPEISEVGGRRADSLPEHPSGNAIDIMIPGWDGPEGKLLGDNVAGFVASNAEALGLTHFIWRQRLYQPGDTTGTEMPDKGSDNENHMNHIHVWLQKGGGKLPTSQLMSNGSISIGGGSPGGGGGSGGSGGGTAAQQRAIREKNDRISDLGNQLDSQQKELDALEADPKTKPTTLERKKDQVAKTTRDLEQAKGDLEDLKAAVGGEGGGTPQEKLAEGINGILPDFGALADIGIGGVKDALLPEGFSDPMEWGVTKMASGLMGFMKGFTKPGTPENALLGMGSAALGGSGSGIMDSLTSLMPGGSIGGALAAGMTPGEGLTPGSGIPGMNLPTPYGAEGAAPVPNPEAGGITNLNQSTNVGDHGTFTDNKALEATTAANYASARKYPAPKQ
jgi:TP901 family phage tail tape measure protein